MAIGDEEDPALVGSPYARVRLLGRGGMGTVLLARHRTLGTKVVVKLMHESYAKDAEALERLRVEAQTQAKLRSPHLLVCHDFGVTAAGAPYFATDYVEGVTLQDELGRRGALPLPEALEIFAQPKQFRGRGQASKPSISKGTDPVSGKEIFLKEGRFGWYVTDGETNATLRRGDTPEEVTNERAVELIAARREYMASPEGQARAAQRGQKQAAKKALKQVKAQKAKAEKAPKTDAPVKAKAPKAAKAAKAPPEKKKAVAEKAQKPAKKAAPKKKPEAKKASRKSV
jgi:hypothetical protein